MERVSAPPEESSGISTNLPDVDEAWPRLMRACVELGDTVAAGGASTVLEDAFQDVAEQAIAIFRREEDVLDASDAPHATTHRKGHLAALSLLADLRRDARGAGGTPQLALRVRGELLGFLREHHALMDSMLGRHVRDWWRSRAEEDD